jgi:hypothetical protein
MHGFLKRLGAGVLAAEHEWNVPQTAAMLDCEDADDFECDESHSAGARGTSRASHQSASCGDHIASGSCSFDEPREDLRALGLL